MTEKRCYKQYCGLAKALDILGERWMLLIIRDLMIGPWRYSDLLERMHGMTTNLLAQRLKDLESHGLIKKTQLSSLGSPHVYELTDLGRELEPVILALGRFGRNFMKDGPQTGDKIDPGRALLALKWLYRGKAKGQVQICFIMADGQTIYYEIIFSNELVKLQYGENRQAPVRIELPMKIYAEIASAGSDASKLEQQGKLTVEGDRKVWLTFLKSFGFTY